MTIPGCSSRNPSSQRLPRRTSVDVRHSRLRTTPAVRLSTFATPACEPPPTYVYRRSPPPLATTPDARLSTFATPACGPPPTYVCRRSPPPLAGEAPGCPPLAGERSKSLRSGVANRRRRPYSSPPPRDLRLRDLTPLPLDRLGGAGSAPLCRIHSCSTSITSALLSITC